MSNTGSPAVATGMEIAVIGMSGRFPGAKNIHRFWDNLLKGIESVSFFTGEEVEAAGVEPVLAQDPMYVKARMILEDIEYFDSGFFNYTPKEAEAMEPQMRLFHECAWEALEDAGYEPESYKGAIGIISGAGSSAYWEALSFFSGNTGWGETMLANKDFIGTRIAYKFNLTGPASTVQTACSTSLVAIHQACRALLTGECKMMIVGGSGLTLPQKQGYLYQEGMILSPDGRCRPFDAGAGGTLGGNGIGVVLLKRLKNAVEDGDYIYAVIKSTAINNDGSKKVGYTAPAVEGQAAAIRTALRMAKVESDSICYVETHGTATPLGDAIEIEALKKAFTADRKAFCALGAVKNNIGHLDAAAGMAGLIKTILILKHKLIPPSLYFENPNPTLNLIDSPFYINTRCLELESCPIPLRAGVSSFGIGGTNVHAILEEAPPREISSPGSQYQLLLFSALSEIALKTQMENFLGYLKKNPTVNIADVAFTLQTGRKFFKYRKMIVCTGTAEAVALLSTPGDTLPFNHGNLPHENELLAATSPPETKGITLKKFLEEIGNAWLTGRTIDWNAYYSGEKRYRIPLPTYPFQRQRYWKDIVLGCASQGVNLLSTHQATNADYLSQTLPPEEWENFTRIERELQAQLKIKGINDYEGLEILADRLCAGYIYYFFENSGIDTGEGQTYNLEDLKKRFKLLTKFEKFFRFFLDVLEQERLISVNGNHIRFLTAKDQIQPPVKLKQEGQEKYPEFKGFFNLLEYCASHYKEALSGEIEAIGVLFPEGKAAADMESFQIPVEFSKLRIYCLLLEKIISIMIDKSPTHKKWRILEIGAGTGTLTKYLVHSLKQMNRDIEYHFTDIGNFFITNAKGDPSYKNLDFMKFELLDISRDPLLQGFQAGYFDMVFGFNVVHAAPDIGEALANMQKLLVPGGLISLIETIRTNRWINMIDGLAEGWWYFRDEDIRKGSPLLNLDAWEDIFKAREFIDVNTFPRDGARRVESDIGLIMARRSLNAKEEPGIFSTPGYYERTDIDAIYSPPADEVEEKLAHLFQQSLGMKVIGVSDDFLQLKVDSLIAITITSKIHKEFNVRIPLPLFFEKATIKELAEYIRSCEMSVYYSIKPLEKREYYLQSSSQKRLYFLQQIDQKGTAYNISAVWLLEGIINEPVLEQSIQELIRRHESLRTSIQVIEEEPVQRIHDEVEFKIDKSFAPPGGGTLKKFIRSFDLSQAPLLRVGLIKLEEEKHIFLVDMHHIISDGVSCQILVQDFSAFYAGKKLPEIKLQYKDYAEWQSREKVNKKIREQGNYWKKEFEGEIPILDLPTDYARPGVQSFEGNVINFELNSEISGALKNLALETGTTLYIVLLAIYTILLSKLSSQEDIIIGSPVAGRSHADLERIIGMFVNTLALRNSPSGEKKFADFLGEVKEKTLKALENQEYQYEDLVETLALKRDASRNPLFDTMFALQNTGSQEIEMPGLKLVPYEYEKETSIFDLSLTIVEVQEKLLLIYEYNTQLFKPDTIEKFNDFLRQIISTILNNREIKIEEIIISHQYNEIEANVFSADLGDFESLFSGE